MTKERNRSSVPTRQIGSTSVRKGESFDDLTIEKDQQLDFFKIFEPARRGIHEYSNTVDVYDALPKYVWSAKREHEDLKNATITRKCTIAGSTFTVKLKPAIIEKEGRSVLIYPGHREEVVEDALRKIAVSGKGVQVNKLAGVSFTLYELMKELERVGHTYGLNEIKEALLVNRGAIIECHSQDGKSLVNSNYFGALAMTTRDDLAEAENRKDARCYVQFNQLVNDSIMNLTFRQYNYQIGMDLRSPFARFIYKRMSQYWVQASPSHPYTPSLISFLEQSPRGVSERMAENLRAMRGALDMLKKHEVVSEYIEEKVLQGKQKVLDAYYTIYPHPSFVKEVIKANHRRKVIAKLGQGNVDDQLEFDR